MGSSRTRAQTRVPCTSRWILFFLLFFFLNKFIYFWLCWILVAVCRPLIFVASPAAEHGLQARRSQQLWYVGSVPTARGLQSSGPAAVAHGPSGSAARGILPGQGSNPCPLHWQADSQPLRHQGSPPNLFFEQSFFFFFEQNFLNAYIDPET